MVFPTIRMPVLLLVFASNRMPTELVFTPFATTFPRTSQPCPPGIRIPSVAVDTPFRSQFTMRRLLTSTPEVGMRSRITPCASKEESTMEIRSEADTTPRRSTQRSQSTASVL